MKKLVGILCLTALVTGAFAQGTVKFQNSSTTLCSYTPQGSSVAVSTPGNGTAVFYYALLTAASGATDWTTFSFANAYATNTAAAGRLQGGSLLGVTASGWPVGGTRAFEIVGWYAPSWVAFDPNWLTGGVAAQAASGLLNFGHSMIAEGAAGGVDPVSGQTLQALALYSGTTITSGFNLDPVPEPTTMALAGLGAAALLIFRRRK